MIDIAHNAEERPVSAKDLAERHGVSPRFFEIMLKNLASAGLIHGQRGPKGGYRLTRPARAICVDDIVSAVSATGDDEGFPLPETVQGQLLPYIEQTSLFIMKKLHEMSLADLMHFRQNPTWPQTALAS